MSWQLTLQNRDNKREPAKKRRVSMIMLDNRSTLVSAIAAGLSLTFTAMSHATLVMPPTDYEAVSPNGKHQFVADYPEWGALRSGDSREVTYSLINTRTGKIGWTIRGESRVPIGNHWPGQSYHGYVSDKGDVLISSVGGIAGYTPLSNADGSVGPRLTFQFDLSEHKVTDNIAMRNIYWRRHLFQAIVVIDNESFLLIRSRWGDRRLIGFKRHEVIDDLSPQQVEACDVVEREWALGILREAPDRLDRLVHEIYQSAAESRSPNYGDNINLNWHIQTAMQMAGREGYREAIPALRAIERWRPAIVDRPEFLESYTRSMDDRNYQYWRTSRVALRRLGERASNCQPLAYSYAAWINYQEHSITRPRERYTFPEEIPLPRNTAPVITTRMTIRKALNLLGAPDARMWVGQNRHTRRFEFDIDADNPYTLRVDFLLNETEEMEPRVTTVEHISPPRWTIEAGRDLDPDWQF